MSYSFFVLYLLGKVPSAERANKVRGMIDRLYSYDAVTPAFNDLLPVERDRPERPRERS